LNEFEIERMEIMKYLGIIIDDRFDLIVIMLRKIGKKTSFLNSIDNFISAYIVGILYIRQS